MSVCLASLGYVDRANPPEAPIVTPTILQENLFRKTDIWLNDVRNQVALVKVILQRGIAAPVTHETVGTPDTTIFSFLDFRRAMTMKKQSRDFIVNISDYQFALVLERPVKGDIIWEYGEFQRFKHVVTAFDSEQPWEFTGAYRQAYRINTKFIEAEDL